MDLGINGKVAMVLGAGGGLGGAIVRELAAEGVRVAASDLNAASLVALGDESSNITPFPLDLRDLSSVDAVIDQIENKLGTIQILVNTTGGPPAGPVVDVTDQAWNDQFEAMVLPIIHLTQRVLPAMQKSGWGRIVTNTSSGVVAPILNLGISNALRSALLGWSKTLATEVGGDGITVNTVVPGRIHTPRIDQLDAARAKRENRDVSLVAADSAATIPVGRYGTPAEYAAAVAFLCSARASFITGSQIRIDGGMIPNV